MAGVVATGNLLRRGACRPISSVRWTLLDLRAIAARREGEVLMSDFGSRPMLSAHEILRFSIEQAHMRVRHVGLHHDRISVSLRDHSSQQNLWELMQIRDTVRLTRFPKLHPPSFDGPSGNRFESGITPELFGRVVATHRSAIVAKIQDLIARLNEDRATVPDLDEEVATAVNGRLQEILQVARRLLPGDFPE